MIKILIATILTIPFLVCLIKYGWNVFRDIQAIIMLISAIIVFVGISIPKLWHEVEVKWFNKIYAKKIKEAGLHEYE